LIEGEALMPFVDPLDPVGAPVAGPADESANEVVAFVVGTFNGSELQPSAGAVPPIDVLNVEQGASVRPAPRLAGVAPVVAEAEEKAGLGAGLT
jgi:hypothetical protein